MRRATDGPAWRWSRESRGSKQRDDAMHECTVTVRAAPVGAEGCAARTVLHPGGNPLLDGYFLTAEMSEAMPLRL